MEELEKQSIIDEEHLKLLVLFHRIYGIIVIVFSFLGIGYYLLFSFLFRLSGNSSHFTLANDIQAPAERFMHIFMIVIAVVILIGLTVGVCNLISAQFIKRRKNRIF
jgi:succinate dehydrogenase/fumarate reductase cytochrome b subunit